jgi:hypothetical protein
MGRDPGDRSDVLERGGEVTRRSKIACGIAAAFVVAGASIGVPILGAGQVGTATVSGIVVDDQDPAKLLSRAIVTVSGPELSTSRSVVTDEKGAFLIGSLPPGRYTVKAEKPSYLTAAVGSKRPSRPGTPLVLTSGSSLSGLVVKLWRGAVVAGRITDESGRPLRAAAVRAVRDGGPGDPGLPVFSNNIIGPSPPGTPGGGATTNDRGEYRIFGLEPGEYVVMVTPPYEIAGAASSMTDAAVDALLAQLRQGRRVAASSAADTASSTSSLYSPSFYPGTADLDAATVLKLAPGQQMTGVDVRAERIPVATVSGVVRTADGSAAVGAVASLYRIAKPTRFTSLRSSSISAAAGPDGSFAITGVPASAYRLTARYRPRGAAIATATGAPTPQDWAWTDLNVTGQDVGGVILSLGPGITVSGTVVFDREDGSTTPLPDLTKATIGIRSLVTNTTPYTLFEPDKTFTIHGGFPDSYQVLVFPNGVGPAWVVRSAISDGRDLLDGPAEFGTKTNVTITFTNRHSELSGRLRASSGAAVSDVFVIAFTTDQRLWGIENRRVQAIRPGADGTFAIRDLPAGEYHLGALLDVDQGDWVKPGFLESVVGSAIKVRITDGRKTVQDLQISR